MAAKSFGIFQPGGEVIVLPPEGYVEDWSFGTSRRF